MMTDIKLGLHNECCLKTMSLMATDSVDLTLTSPPYDNMRDYSGTGAIDFEAIAKELYRITKQGGVLVWVIADQTKDGNETGTSFRHALFFKEIGFNLFDTMIYAKPSRGAIGSDKTYYNAFEYMFVFSKGLPKTINLIYDRKNIQATKNKVAKIKQKDGSVKTSPKFAYGEMGRRTNIWQYTTGKGNSSKDAIAFEHPAIFPEKLAKDHITSWTNEGDIIYDPFMGSGTTAKMATLLNRNWIGSEISSDYCDIINKRLELIRGLF